MKPRDQEFYRQLELLHMHVDTHDLLFRFLVYRKQEPGIEILRTTAIASRAWEKWNDAEGAIIQIEFVSPQTLETLVHYDFYPLEHASLLEIIEEKMHDGGLQFSCLGVDQVVLLYKESSATFEWYHEHYHQDSSMVAWLLNDLFKAASTEHYPSFELWSEDNYYTRYHYERERVVVKQLRLLFKEDFDRFFFYTLFHRG